MCIEISFDSGDTIYNKSSIFNTTEPTTGIEEDNLLRILKRAWLACGEWPSVEDIEEGRFPPVNGIGLYQVGSLINHDCEPNCELIFDESSPL